MNLFIEFAFKCSSNISCHDKTSRFPEFWNTKIRKHHLFSCIYKRYIQLQWRTTTKIVLENMTRECYDSS